MMDGINMHLNHEQQKERARAEAEHHQRNSNVTGSYSEEDRNSLNAHGGVTAPANKEYSGQGSNQKEYAEVESNLKAKHIDRKPVYNRKHDMYE